MKGIQSPQGVAFVNEGTALFSLTVPGKTQNLPLIKVQKEE